MRANQLEPLAVSPRQAALLSSLSKRKVQELMSNGALPFYKVGRRTVIPFVALKKFLFGE
jgi:excisionase family DNA binding protein